jgi:hypothetical protein
LLDTVLGAAIELQWQGAQIRRILAPDGKPVPEELYASMIWKRPSMPALTSSGNDADSPQGSNRNRPPLKKSARR